MNNIQNEINNENVFGYIDELNNEELYNLKEQIIKDIEFLKKTKNKNDLNFEIERLRYISNLLKSRENINIKTP